VGKNAVKFAPSRHYLGAGLVLVSLAALSAWCGTRWPAAWAPAVVLAGLGGALTALTLQPSIILTADGLRRGRRFIPWGSIRRLDHTEWLSPLILKLELENGKRRRLVYAGEPDASRALLLEIRRNSLNALIDGYRYEQVAQELMGQAEELVPEGDTRYRLLRSEDEAEIERLFQKLKTVGRLDGKDES
jgi:hypothetical protein